MKVGILTFHDADNYGAVLQAYGLKKSLSNYVDCEIINYYNDYFHRTSVPSGILAKIMGKVHKKALERKKKAFKNFRDQYLTCGSPVINDDQLEALNDRIDLFISGSDQVWNLNCSGGKKCYFLPFVKDNNKKCSYAVSFGTDYPQLDDEYKEFIRQFNKIAMRESSGCTYVKDVIGRENVRVLDPTLLLRASEWDNLLKTENIKAPKGRFILIYEVVNGKNMEEFAQKLEKEKGLPVYCITASNRIKKGIKTIRSAGPIDWLSLIKNSEYVITNSFHGLVFSLIFNKQFFVELLPPPAATNARMIEMLSSVGLENRVIDEHSQISNFDQISYENVNRTLSIARENSINYIRNIVGIEKE